MRILVTGGAGFIGTHLCRRLVSEGHFVRVLDLKDPKAAVPSVSYERGDVRDSKIVERLVREADAVYHFAAIVSVPLCQEKPVESHQTNLLATLQVLDAISEEQKRRNANAQARPKRPIRLIFSGSSVVYGASCQSASDRCVEDSAMAWPLSFYGAQKLGSEHAIRLYFEHHHIPSVVFRFFNVYGPGQDPKSPYSGVISIFSDAIREGRPLHLHGGGSQTRDFISVHDVVDACVRALDAPDDQCTGQAFNLGTGTSVTIRSLAEKMAHVVGRNVDLIETPAREGDVKFSLASIARAERILEWHPKVSLEQGLSELLIPRVHEKRESPHPGL